MLYGQHKWLYVFLGFTSNYTLYAQYKQFYILNYAPYNPNTQLYTYNYTLYYTLYVIRKLCVIIIQKTKTLNYAPYNPNTRLYTYNYTCIIMHIQLCVSSITLHI